MKRVSLLAAALVCLVFPLFSKGSGREFVADMLIFAILAVGLYVQVGLLGMINFGFAAFFGLGAYAGALLLSRWTPALLPSIALSIIGVSVVALLFGALAIRLRDTAFTILTLTFSQLLYVLAVADDRFTDGINGVIGVPRPALPMWLTRSTGLTLDSDTGYYYFVLAVFALVVAGVYALQRSRLGAVFAGIRENEERMVVLGYAVSRYKLAGFVLSSAIGALAGYLNAGLYGYAGPTSLFWTVSGEAILMVTLGGTTSLLGPVVGALGFTSLSHYAVAVTDHWRLFVGMVFIAIVMYAPQGVVPIVRQWLQDRSPKRKLPAPEHAA
jgi:ABC-type branched-subunit amino acid transport system permease subunit